jgi:hypothetical protein
MRQICRTLWKKDTKGLWESMAGVWPVEEGSPRLAAAGDPVRARSGSEGGETVVSYIFVRYFGSLYKRVDFRRSALRLKSAFEIPSMLPLLSSSLEYFSSLRHALEAASPGPDRSGGVLWRWDLASPPTVSPCGCPPPSPEALCVFCRARAGLEEATPARRRRAAQARQCPGSPPPAPRSRGDAAPPSC